MKKIYFLSMAAASLMLASCSNDDMPAPESGDFATVAVSVQLPDGLQTRYGEGEKATYLTYAVYEQGQKKPLAVCMDGSTTGLTVGHATLTNVNGHNQTTLNLKLATNKKYDFVFWADVPDNPYYTFTADTQTIAANYSTLDNGTPANLEELDAFYCSMSHNVNGNASISAQLKRPFAQVNVVTDDLATAETGGFIPNRSSLSTTVGTSLNLKSGAVAGEETVTFAANALPEGSMEINGKAYDYIGMNYLLVPAEKSLRDIDFTLLAAGTENVETHVYNFNSVPVQRNYRTNIYGSLLTSSQNFNVIIVPDFNEPDYQYQFVSTFADMKAQLNAGNNVQVANDISTEATTVVFGQGNVLNLNGKTIAATAPIADFSNNNSWSLFSVRGGQLTVNGNGTVMPLNQVNDAFAFDVQGGHLIIESGNFYGNDHVVYVWTGTAEIRGGRFEVMTNSDSNITNYVLNCYDANYKNGTAHIIVTGGTFINFNPADCAAEGAHTNFVAEGYKSVKVSDSPLTYEVVPE